MGHDHRIGRFAPGDRSGIYHLTCGGQASWFEFAKAIRESGLALDLLPKTKARLEAIPSSEYPTPARRPSYSVLSNDKLHEAFALRMANGREALALCLEQAR